MVRVKTHVKKVEKSEPLLNDEENEELDSHYRKHYEGLSAIKNGITIWSSNTTFRSGQMKSEQKLKLV